MSSLPQTHKSLLLTSTSSPLEIVTSPTPLPTPGSAIVHVLATNIVSYAREILNGTRSYPFPTPFVPGSSGIGRVVTLGPDSTHLKEGDLVLLDPFIHSRDDPSTAFLFGIYEGYTSGSQKLMRGEWRNATFAEYAKVPLENCYILDEEKLVRGFGYEIEELADIARLMVPYGGLCDIGLKAGETIVVSPATGPFGSAAVEVALAMGAKVIAMGRNVEVLERIKMGAGERVEIVQMTGDFEKDLNALKEFGNIDAFFDISPPAASQSTHLKSAILALRSGGRISLMGGIQGDVALPHGAIVHRDLVLKGKWMYTRQNVRDLIKMVEMGLLRLGRSAGKEVVKFVLEDWYQAFESAAMNAGSLKQTVLVP